MSYYFSMETEALSIDDVASAAGVSRRAVRFYVQRGLLPQPNGRGRGRHYDARHVVALGRIRRLQHAGHSLDAIGRILAGEAEPDLTSGTPPRARPALSAGLWTRLEIADGVELQFDATVYNPPVEDLLALKDAIRRILGTAPVPPRPQPCAPPCERTDDDENTTLGKSEADAASGGSEHGRD